MRDGEGGDAEVRGATLRRRVRAREAGLRRVPEGVHGAAGGGRRDVARLPRHAWRAAVHGGRAHVRWVRHHRQLQRRPRRRPVDQRPRLLPQVTRLHEEEGPRCLLRSPGTLFFFFILLSSSSKGINFGIVILVCT